MALATYLRLADKLEADIAALPGGARVASEKDLAAEHGVNRLTARAAVLELERRYRVRRYPGRGTFVSKQAEYRFSINNPSPAAWDEVGRSTVDERLETLSVRTRPATTAMSGLLALPARARVTRLTQRRYINGEPGEFIDISLPAELVPNLRHRLPSDGYIYKALNDVYDLDPVRVSITIDMDIPPPSVSEALGLKSRPLMSRWVSRLDTRRLNRPLTVTTSWCRPDLVRVVFEFTGGPSMHSD